MADATVCVGCLGTRECWVCLGRGDYGPALRPTRCRRCSGTGRCDLCAERVDLTVIEPAEDSNGVR